MNFNCTYILGCTSLLILEILASDETSRPKSKTSYNYSIIYIKLANRFTNYKL